MPSSTTRSRRRGLAARAVVRVRARTHSAPRPAPAARARNPPSPPTAPRFSRPLPARLSQRRTTRRRARPHPPAQRWVPPSPRGRRPRPEVTRRRASPRHGKPHPSAQQLGLGPAGMVVSEATLRSAESSASWSWFYGILQQAHFSDARLASALSNRRSSRQSM